MTLPINILEFRADTQMAGRLWAFDCNLYRDDASWIAPFRKHYLQHYSEDHDLYAGARDHCRHFVAEFDGQLVGHVSAFVNHRLRDGDQAVGAIGRFECIQSEAVASQMMRRAVAWLESEHGLHRVWGPMNFDIWHGYRLMTRGFELDAFAGEPRNPRYYPSFFESCGFRPRKCWETVEMTDRQSIEALKQSSHERYVEILKKGYEFNSINVRDAAQVEALTQMIVDSYQRFTGFTEPPERVMQELAATAQWTMDPTLSCLAVDPMGVPCGFGIAYPDQSAALRAMGGHLGVWGRLKFLMRRSRAGNRVVFYLIGIIPSEFDRRQGLGRAIFYATMDRISRQHFPSLLFAIIADDSPARSLLGRFMELSSREYTLYQLG